MRERPAETELEKVTSLLGLVARDGERLLDQHAALLRSEVRQGIRAAGPPIAEIGVGAGLLGIGTGLGILTMVHGLNHSTRLPLWSCYGIIGGMLTAAGAGLMARGGRRAASLPIMPRETINALREDVRWIRDQLTASTGQE